MRRIARENGALAIYSSDALSSVLWSRASYLGLDDDRISKNYLVVHSNWDCGPGSLASLTV